MLCAPSRSMSLLIAKSVLILAGTASGGIYKAVGNFFRLQFTILTPVIINLYNFFYNKKKLCFLIIAIGLVS